MSGALSRPAFSVERSAFSADCLAAPAGYFRRETLHAERRRL